MLGIGDNSTKNIVKTTSTSDIWDTTPQLLDTAGQCSDSVCLSGESEETILIF